MIQILCLSLFMLLGTWQLSQAQVSDLGEQVSVPLTWEAPANGVPTGYRVYLGDATGVYHSTFDVGMKLGHTLDSLTPGRTYFAAVKAYNVQGDSPFSNELRFTPNTTVTIDAPQNLHIPGSVPVPAPARSQGRTPRK